MSATETSVTDALVPVSRHRDSVADFVRWGLAQLNLHWEETEGRAALDLNETDRPAFNGAERIYLAMDSAADTSGAHSLDLQGDFCSWLKDKLREKAAAVSVRPIGQPMGVNEIVSRLFGAYQVDSGRVHLGGCQLDDLAFLRLTFPGRDEQGQPCVSHVFVAHDGTSVSDELAEKLGLQHVEPILDLPPRIDGASLNALVSAGRRCAAQSCSDRNPAARIVEPLATALVWVKQASGKLLFTVDEDTVELPFSGWARLVEAPPYRSAVTRASGYHLAATDDGRIDLADEIAVCQHSGRRVLRQELVTCSVTGKQVLGEFTDACPVSGQPTLKDEFQTCDCCQQLVSRAAQVGDVCSACRNLSKVRGDDPRLVWIFSEHRGLESWSRWKIAETENVYIAQASSLLKRLLLVVDKESLQVRHLATGGRLSSSWRAVPAEEQSEFLG